MEEITVDKNKIASCGLYCGACRKFLSGKCLGCKDNEAVREAKQRKDLQELDALTHHLRSSWE
ncbi:hypothetical protein E5342_19130, partial [Parabacteroides distasonis]